MTHSQKLSVEQVKQRVLDKIAIHQSLSSSKRHYKIIYNSDYTFQMITIENGIELGKTTGTFKIIDKNGIGYLYIKYKNIFPSTYKESTFNPFNENSIYKTKKNLLGPFYSITYSERSASLLLYRTDYSKLLKIMHLYDQCENETV